MKPRPLLAWLLCLGLLCSSCATYKRQGLEPALAERIEREKVRREFRPGDELRQKILALNPEQVTDEDVREVLSQAPAPRIINIHGGIYPVHRRMISSRSIETGSLSRDATRQHREGLSPRPTLPRN